MENDVLVMDQIRGLLSNDCRIYDANGGHAGSVQTEGGVGVRMLMGVRQLAVVEADGALIMRLDDVPNLGRDRFALLGANGQQLGQVTKEFTLFSKQLTIELVTGQYFSLKGSLFDREFTVTGPGGQVAQVTRHWPGLAAGLLGRERYVLAFSDPEPFHRGAILGAVLALDLIREKQRRRD